nr:uncharacterized mitochondrial protein AtMg00810-like [Tanacetum cinerariifolium]
MIQVRLNVPVRRIQTDNGTEFVNRTLRDYSEEVGIFHETSVARSPQQNGVVERHNRTLIEAARTMLIYAQAPLFLWVEAVATACFTQNRSIIRLRHGKTPYEHTHSKLSDLSFFHVFSALCYATNDSENLGKLQPKADIGIFIGYAPTKKAFRIYNRCTRRIVKIIHVDFDELTAMASEQSSSGPALNDMTPGTISSGLVQQSSSSASYVPPSRNDWDLNRMGLWIRITQIMYFSKGLADPTLFIRRNGNDLLLVQIYVDDIIFVASTLELCDLFANLMCSKFKMSMMGKISFFLGLQISQNPRGILINQSKYALESLKKYGFESCHPVDTPMVEKSKLDEDKEGKAIDPSHYRGMIGTLFYLTASRPDLQFTICMCTQYQARPTEKHVHAVKRICRYLRGTVNRGLWYPKDYSVALTAFADADHAGYQDTRRSTSGSVQFLGERLIS